MSCQRTLAFLLLTSAPLAAMGCFDAFGYRWCVPVLEDWKLAMEDGKPVLHLLVPRPSTQPRRPTQFALANTADYLQVTVEAEVKKEPFAARKRRTSLMFVYAYRDADHFNYAHLSVDAAKEANHHNGIFHVDGGDRVRISSLDGPGTLIEDKWQKVRLDYNGRSGQVKVYVDGATSPSLTAVDKTFGAGRVGIGSFFDLGSFRSVKITGQTAGKIGGDR